MNKTFLAHDFYTDIITFDYTEQRALHIEAYISIDRVKENAQLNGQSFKTELHRVMVHGMLHAIGFKDKTIKEIKAMREAENVALNLWNTFQALP